ncbi:ShlB/FhaC/HecB family hemolysin secretion/activation protein [Paraburkholderia bryophila]|uniref:ShlB/FhaC/HecB family hemolysin secretion/activation protein n=1 Tax=Paraburkholderia bryophila TaxID=420952 RepID=UPI00234A15FD|nr:ShlB/FhaC/HecB family hemolysin secretion/activation protein [Paraburkholderia bryophila]WCM18268.1 ShlB/FhaC/HecB family hemolysin secretion/activation protein [Paraburkholderia bryophila]WCM23310.1 ShlB/FhaC/HecB family hemolysin secretion/activation protein [Paraburkholderia bryophila]
MKRTVERAIRRAVDRPAPRLAHCTLAILAGTAVARGYAQTPPGLPNVGALGGAAFGVPARVEQDPAQRLLQEQRDRQRRDEIQQPPAQIDVPQQTVVNLPEGADVETLPDVEPLFRIDHVEFIGDTVLGKSELDTIAAPFIGKQLGRNRINLLLRRVTEAFIARGYITTRAYLGAQSLASGTLKVNLVDGKVSAFTLNGHPLRPRDPNEPWYTTHGGGLLTDAGTAWAFADSRGDVLRLPDLEQGVDQINRLRRNKAEIQIMPGETPGDSVVAITNHYGDRVFYDLGIDNYGSSQTGTLRYRAGVEADNLIGLQESLSFNYVGTQDSNAVVFSAAAPYGYQTFSYTTSLSEYQQTISDVALLQGRTFSQTLGWNDVLTRSRAGRTSVDVTLTKMRTERSLNGIDLSPQGLTVLRVGLNGLRRFVAHDQAAAATWDVGVSQGLPWLSASHDGPDIDEVDAHSQFTKLDATATLQVALGTLAGTQWTYRGTLRGQYSHVALFGNEQIFLGGMDSVRGFTEGGIAGDSGFYLRNEAAWQNVPAWHDLQVEPYVFLDGGKSHLVAQGGWPTLMGTGLGARMQWRHNAHTVTSEVLLGQALLQPAALGKKATVLLATLNWSL